MFHNRFLASSPGIDRIDIAAVHAVGSSGAEAAAPPSCSRTIPCGPRMSPVPPHSTAGKDAWASHTPLHSGNDAARTGADAQRAITSPLSNTPHEAAGLARTYNGDGRPPMGSIRGDGGRGSTPNAAPLSRRTLSPQAATTMAGRSAAPSVALLRHSHGGTTRILYADGHVETIVAGTASTPTGAATSSAPSPPLSPPSAAALDGAPVRASAGGPRPSSPRSWSPTSGAKTSASRAGSTTTSRKAPSAAAAAGAGVHRPWLLKSFDAVAQVHQASPLPPSTDPAMAPQWGRPPSLRSPIAPFSGTGSISAFASPTETDYDFRPSRFHSTSSHTVPATREPSRVFAAHVPPQSTHDAAGLVTPLLNPLHSSSTRDHLTECFREGAGADAGDRTTVFLTSVMLGASSTGRADASAAPLAVAVHQQQQLGSLESASSRGDGGCGSPVPGSALPAVVRTSLQFEVHSDAGAESGIASVDAAATQVLIAMQCGIRAEMAAEQRAAAQTYASRFSRDVSASPSIFSLRFPFRPLSEVHAFAARPEGDVGAAAAAWAALGISPASLHSGLPSTLLAGSHGGKTGTSPGNINTSTSSLSTVAAAVAAVQASANAQVTAAAAALSPHATEVLLADAQTTTPSGFTIPELLNDRLLPREVPALRHKLTELCSVRGLVDSSDTTACRFAVSFVWFALLRCRKAHREQSLVDGYLRLSRAFSDAFPHVAMADTLPPLDVLEELLVELQTCLQFSAQVESAAALANADDDGEGVRSGGGGGGGSSVSRRTLATTGGRFNTTTNTNADASVSVAAPPVDRDADNQPPSLSLSATRHHHHPAPSKSGKDIGASAGGGALAPVAVPLRVRLQDHRACFPLLLTPTWSKLINPASPSVQSTGDYDATPVDATLSQHRPATKQPSSAFHLRRSDEQGVLPATESLTTLVKVYHDLWQHHSEYVQLCLYEELLYKQLALLFGSFIMHLHQAGPATGPKTAPAAGVLSPNTSATPHSFASLPTVGNGAARRAGAGGARAVSAETDASGGGAGAAAAAAAGGAAAYEASLNVGSIASVGVGSDAAFAPTGVRSSGSSGGGGKSGVRRSLGSMSGAPTTPKHRAGTNTNSTAANTTATATATATLSAAAVATPVVKDGILESLLILVAHATYYNCTFCFPNDVYAGLFDDEFRSDVVRWLSFCCHGVVLTHVQVRHWPTPAKSDYAAAQLKRKAAVERELAALGLLQVQPQSHSHASLQRSPASSRTPVASVAPSSPAHTALGDGDNASSLVLGSDDAAFDFGDVAANSESRLAYQLDRYGRAAALHVADLERCMARLQRRHQTTTGAPHGAIRRGRSGSLRTPIGSRRSSLASAANLLMQGTDLAATFGGRRGSATPGASPIFQKRCGSAVAAAPSPPPQRSSTLQAQLGRARLETGTGAARSSSARTADRSADTLAAHPAAAEIASGGAASSRRSRSHHTSTAGGASASPRRPRRGRLPGGGGATAAAAMAQARLVREQEEARAQYRTSAAVPVDKNLVFVAAELRGAGASVKSVAHVHHHAALQGDSDGGAEGAERAEGALPESMRGPSRRTSLDVHKDQRRGGRRQGQATSLLASYPLCSSPAPILEYWLSTLIRAPCWWTTRTGVATATAVAGAAAATSPAALQQQSAQLVLWSSVPIGADGAVMPAHDLCRLQLEPWRGIFDPIVVVPPISDEAQQAKQRIRVYARTLPRQQVRLYRLVELQLVQREQRELLSSHHQPPVTHAHAQWRLYEHTGNAAKAASPGLPFLAPADISASGLSAGAAGLGPTSPAGLHLPPVGGGRTGAAASGAVAVPSHGEGLTDAASPLSANSLPSRRAAAAAPVIPGTQCDAVCASSAMLPHVPVMTAKEAAAQAATSTSNMLMAGAGVAGVSSVRHRMMGETYQGCTSPFFMLYSASFKTAAAPGSRSHRSGRRTEPMASASPSPPATSLPGLDGGGEHGAGSDPGRPTSAGTLPSLATSLGWGPVSSSRSQVLPALAAATASWSGAAAGAGASPTSPRTSPGAAACMGHPTLDGDSPRSRHGAGCTGRDKEDDNGGGCVGAAAASRPPTTKGMSTRLITTFAITAIPREEAKLRPRRLGPLKKEALRRHAQLLTDMATIEKRDQVARQQYVVQHLRLSNAMAYTQSEPMMRRFRAHGRLALERLAGGEISEAAAQHAAVAAATARANAERAKKHYM